MYSKLLCLAAVTAFLPLPHVFAGTASVNNLCTFATYIQENAPGQPQITTTLLPYTGDTEDSYVAPIQYAGTAIKIGWHPQLSSPLTFEFTPGSDGNLYYDLSSNAGTGGLSGDHVTLYPSKNGCPFFDCLPNAANCYSTGANPKIGACSNGVDLNVTLCAPGS